MTATTGPWWAAYDDGTRHFVVPVVAFDDQGAPYVWSVDTHGLVPAVRTSFVGIVSDHYRGEFGELVATAIARAHDGHPGEASHARAEGADVKDLLRDGIERARDVIHDATDRTP